MKEKIPPYIKYTKDSDHYSDYFTYQNKYRQSIRESDSVIINIIEKLSEDDDSMAVRKFRVLVKMHEK